LDCGDVKNRNGGRGGVPNGVPNFEWNARQRKAGPRKRSWHMQSFQEPHSGLQQKLENESTTGRMMALAT
jgi:hypothetical protein